jgi:ABC-type lipoprotein release transport system permease subunit
MGISTKLAAMARLARKRKGQAMVEYSAVLFALAMAGGVGIIVVLPSLMNALDRYLQGIYYMLNLAIP